MKRIKDQMNRIFTIAFLFFNAWAIAQPSITSFSPTSGEVGTAITITGTGFNTTAANNVVYFGGMRATVTAATSTALTVEVPNGSISRSFISVTSGGLTSQSSVRFKLINNNIATATRSFPNRGNVTNIGAGANPTSEPSANNTDVIVGVGDFDNDGWPDIFKGGINNLAVNRNLLTGTNTTLNTNQFSAPISFAVSGTIRTIATGDIDLDGKLDIITGSTSGLSILRNTSTTGSISFATAVNISTSTTCIRVADFDYDGKIDIAAVSNNVLNIFKNTSTPGSVSFNAAVATALSATSFNGVDIGDLNNDGKIDLAVSKGSGSNGVTNIIINNSASGTLSLSNSITIANGNHYILIDDIDNDGKNDIYIWNINFKSNYTTGTLASSNFTAVTNAQVNEGASGSSSLDINGDGFPEVVLGTWWSHFHVQINSSTGFTAKEIYASVGGTALGADLNGDQKVDIISSAIGNNAGNAAIALNQNNMAPTSGITATCAFSTFGQCAANTNPSANQTMTISGSGLTADIVIGAATNFEYSLDNITYSSTLTIPFGIGTVAPTTVFVRYNRIDLGSDRVDIPISSSITAGARKLIIAATGVRVLPAISGAATVCSGSNSTVLTLSGHTGTVTRWESSTSSTFASGITNIVNTTTTLTATNLTTTTYYRAVLAGGSCGAINTDPVMITVNTSTIGGTLTIFNGTSQLTGSGIADANTPWTSSDISVATISNTGLVTAISGGTSTITYKENTGCTVTAIFTVTMPKITVSAAALNAFTTCAGTVSGSQSFTVSGINLTDNIIITPPVGFEISSTSATTGYNATSLTLTRTGGTVATRTIFVRTTTSATGTPSGNVSMNSTGVTQVDKAVSATINVLPTIGGTITVFNGTSQLTGSGIADATTPWTSSNTSVATISNTGLVTAIAGGTSTITYRVNTGCIITALFTVTMPTITVSAPALTAFTGCTGFNSTTQNFTVSGINLTSDIIISAPSGFEISSTSASTGFNQTSLTLIQSGGTVPNTSIHVRTTTASTGSPSGNVSMNSTGVTQIDKAVSATINVTPTISGILTKQRTETSQLTGSGTPHGTTPWASSNTAIATVSNTGLVTAVGAGTCTITYRVSSGCTMTAAFTTTPVTIYANSNTGDDINNGLTQLTAKKTFTAAFNTAAAGDIIDLTGTFTWGNVGETTAVTTGLTITKNITIRGQGADQTIIQANALSNTANRRVFTINSGVTVVLEKITIRHGNSGAGGGIYNLGNLTINYCSVSFNTSNDNGGGLKHDANNTLTLVGCTFNNNVAPSGGALSNKFENNFGHMIITNCTFAYNKQTAAVATVGGGAIWVLNGNNIITNTTFAYNDLNFSGGSGTGDGASIFLRQGNVRLKNSIFVNGTRSGQPLSGGRIEIGFAGGSATDEGNNIFGTQTGITYNASSWQPSSGGGYQNVGDNTKKCVLNVDTVLGSNGATNGTVSLKTTGLNIEEGSTIANNGISIPTIDQRGNTRVGTPDIGAYEYTDIEPFVTCFSPSTGAAGTSVAIKGVNLTGASSVKFNSVDATTYTVNSGFLITATAPQSNTGLISVTTNQGTANSSSNYTYPPSIVKTGTLTTFTKCAGRASAAQTFTVSGSNLTANLVVAAYTNLEYSLDSISYSASLSLSPSSGSVATRTIYVRMTAASTSLTSGNISITSTNATTQTFAVSGTVNALPSVTGTFSLTTNASQLTGSSTAAASNPWVSSNTAVATVSNTGLVTPISSGTSTITYTNSLGCSATATVTVTMPTITTSVNSLTAFSGCPNLESTTQTFTVSGTNLSANISIAAPTGFEISTAATSGYSNTLTLTRSGSNVASTTIYARMAALSSSPSAGNISLTTTNATTKTIAVSGEVISGGSIAGSASVCTGTNSTVLTLSGHTAAIEKWQSSTSSTFASAVTDILNTSTTHTASNLSTTTYYRAILLNTCPVYSTIATVTVSPDPVVTGTLDVYEDNTTQLACSDAPATSTPWISLNTSLLTISNTGLITGVYPGIGTVVYTTSIGCKDTVTVNVHETEWTGTHSNDITTGANWKLNSQPSVIKKIRFNSNASNNMILTSKMVIDSIDFGTSNRQIELVNNDLIVNHIRNFNANRYIKTTGTGKVKKQLTNNTPFTFPVGNKAYNPITITNKTGTADTFSVNILDTAYLNGSTSGNISNPYVKRTWNISKNTANANAGSGVDLTFNWNVNEVVGTLTNPTLNHHNGTSWEIPTMGTTTVSGNSLTYTGYKGTFSPFAIGGSNVSALPVELKSFIAECHSDYVNINWTTASEIRNKTFELYKSDNAIEWTLIHTTEGQGDKATETDYSFKDMDKNSTYYRLKDLDFDGIENWSQIIFADCKNESAQIEVYPNPASEFIKVIIPFEEHTTLNILSMEGKTIKSMPLVSKNNLIHIKDLSTGVYFIEINGKTASKTIKIVKE